VYHFLLVIYFSFQKFNLLQPLAEIDLAQLQVFKFIEAFKARLLPGWPFHPHLTSPFKGEEICSFRQGLTPDQGFFPFPAGEFPPLHFVQGRDKPLGLFHRHHPLLMFRRFNFDFSFIFTPNF
jgi:hypothetical protein